MDDADYCYDCYSLLLRDDRYDIDDRPHVTEAAAEAGHLSCLMRAHKDGHRFTYDAFVAAAEAGHLACLRFMHNSDRGRTWTRGVLEGATEECRRYIEWHQPSRLSRCVGCAWERRFAAVARRWH